MVCRCEAGTIMVLTAAIFGLMLVCVALVIDVGRLYAVESKAQNAVDAALLGAVSTVSTMDLQTEAQRLFNANFPANYMGATVSDIAAAEVTTGVYEATVSMSVPTLLMGMFGRDGMADVSVQSQATKGFDVTQNRRLEVALVLDNTGSMGGGKLDSLKQAANDLIDILFGDAASLNNLVISVVPYDIVVQIGTGKSGWIQSPSRAKYDAIASVKNKGFAFNRFTDYLCGPYTGQKLCHDAYCTSCPATPAPCPPETTVCNTNCDAETGACKTSCHKTSCKPCVPTCYAAGCYAPTNEKCVPNGLNDLSDDAPISEATRFRLPYENRINETMPWVTKLAPMLFGSNKKSEVKTAINSMQVSGNTRINVGLMWGWFSLSPKWQGVWDAGKPQVPASANPLLDKALVLMTDGKNIYSGDDERTQRLCGAVKAQGVTVYTVGFGSAGDINEELLRKCASRSGYYFHAPTAERLRTVFRQIADDISHNTLRLSK